MTLNAHIVHIIRALIWANGRMTQPCLEGKVTIPCLYLKCRVAAQYQQSDIL